MDGSAAAAVVRRWVHPDRVLRHPSRRDDAAADEPEREPDGTADQVGEGLAELRRVLAVGIVVMPVHRRYPALTALSTAAGCRWASENPTGRAPTRSPARAGRCLRRRRGGSWTIVSALSSRHSTGMAGFPTAATSR